MTLLYGTDAISEDDGAERRGPYNPERGGKVIAWARDFHNESVPLSGVNWCDITRIHVKRFALVFTVSEKHEVTLRHVFQLPAIAAMLKRQRELLTNNGIHIDIILDTHLTIGSNDVAHISDLVLESALTTIMGCEDWIAAVDADDNVVV